MRFLENNFTTNEQSKMLVSIGLSPNTADCSRFVDNKISVNPFSLGYNDFLESYVDMFGKKYYYPCWSVGRLIAILERITEKKFSRTDKDDVMEDVLDQIKKAFDEGLGEIRPLKNMEIKK